MAKRAATTMKMTEGLVVPALATVHVVPEGIKPPEGVVALQ